VNNLKMTAVYYYMERDGARTMVAVAVCVVEPTLEQSILVMDIKDKVKHKHLSLAQVDVFDLAVFSRGTEINNSDAWDPDAMDGSTKEKPLQIVVTTTPYPTAGMSLCARYSNRNCVRSYFAKAHSVYQEIPRMHQAIVTLSGLSVAEVEILAQEGVSSEDELMNLTFEDIGHYIPNASLLVRRKLSNLARFVSGGNDVTGSTTMKEVMRALAEMERPLPAFHSGENARTAEALIQLQKELMQLR
jgi:hypothetical protein